MGYPGAGKTHIARMIAEQTGAVHISSDEFHTKVFPKLTFSELEHEIRYNALDYITELLIKNGISVIYDANLNQRKHRAEKYAICKQYGVSARLVWVATDRSLSEERATKYAADDPLRPYGNLKGETFNRIADGIELPADDEPYVKINGQNVTPEDINELTNQ